MWDCGLKIRRFLFLVRVLVPSPVWSWSWKKAIWTTKGAHARFFPLAGLISHPRAEIMERKTVSPYIAQKTFIQQFRGQFLKLHTQTRETLNGCVTCDKRGDLYYIFSRDDAFDVSLMRSHCFIHSDKIQQTHSRAGNKTSRLRRLIEAKVR